MLAALVAKAEWSKRWSRDKVRDGAAFELAEQRKLVHDAIVKPDPSSTELEKK